MVFEKVRYIAVDGPIGAGKSTLARMLAEDLGASALFETPDENPFLPFFYDNPDQYAFQTQLYFLLSRYKQHKQLASNDYGKGLVVCDYHFAKDLIFAKLNLIEEEYELYQSVFRLLDEKIPKPDLVIALQAGHKVLMERIRKREKDYEDNITDDYVKRVSEAFSEYYFQYTDTPLLVVNTTNLDLVNQKEGYELLKKELVNLIETGKQKHYVTIQD